MFRKIKDRPRFNTHVLDEIAELQHRPTRPPEDFQTKLPAGYTYFGQFIAHDMTRLARSARSPSANPVDTDLLEQLESPELDLRSLYGAGLDDPEVPYDLNTGKFWANHQDGNRIRDIPRDNDGAPRIADGRNDENVILSQLHAALMSVHNQLIDWYGGTRDAYPHARRELTLLYQRVIENDFLRRLLDAKVHRTLFRNSDLSYEGTFLKARRGFAARITVEFVGAAMRFGHSMVRSSYDINERHDLDLDEIFRLTGRGGGWREIHADDKTVTWPLQLKDGNTALPIDYLLTPTLQRLPNEPTSPQALARRNLIRGIELDLPSAQQIVRFLQEAHEDYATTLGIELLDVAEYRNYRSDETESGTLVDVLTDAGLLECVPLWLYVLMEGYLASGNVRARLGPLGSMIVAEQIRALITSTNHSIYSTRFDPSRLQAVQREKFKWRRGKLLDLLNIAINPQ